MALIITNSNQIVGAGILHLFFKSKPLICTPDLETAASWIMLLGSLKLNVNKTELVIFPHYKPEAPLCSHLIYSTTIHPVSPAVYLISSSVFSYHIFNISPTPIDPNSQISLKYSVTTFLSPHFHYPSSGYHCLSQGLL